MKTLVSQPITIIPYKNGLYISSEPIYQAMSDLYDQTGFKIVRGLQRASTGICPKMNFHINLN